MHKDDGSTPAPDQEPQPPPILFVPEDQLSAADLKEKKKQLFLFNAARGRWKQKQIKEAAKAKEVRLVLDWRVCCLTLAFQAEEKRVLQEQFNANPQEFLANLHERRNVCACAVSL